MFHMSIPMFTDSREEITLLSGHACYCITVAGNKRLFSQCYCGLYLQCKHDLTFLIIVYYARKQLQYT